jgi:hypothetical protein
MLLLVADLVLRTATEWKLKTRPTLFESASQLYAIVDAGSQLALADHLVYPKMPAADQPPVAVSFSDIKGDAQEVAIPPDQAASADGAKIIKGKVKVQGQHRQILCANAGASVCDVSNAARAHADLSAKE